MKSLINLLVISTILSSLLFVQHVEAGGFHISILGVRRTGMMTTLAHPDDATALFHNPAAMVLLKDTKLHLSSGLPFLNTTFQLQGLDPSRFPNIDSEKWPTFDRNIGGGVIRPYYEANLEPERYFGIIPYLGFTHPISDRLVIGGALYAPGAYGASLPKEAPSAYFVTEGLFVIASATMGAAYAIIPEKLSLGFNVSVTYMQLGYGQRFSVVDVLDDPEEEGIDVISGLANGLYGDLDMSYEGNDMGFGFGLGLWAKPLDFLEIGIGYGDWSSPSFMGDVKLRSLGNGEINPVTGQPFPDSPIFRQQLDDTALRKDFETKGRQLPKKLNVNMTIPPSIMAGINATFGSFQIGFDYRLWRYSMFQEQRVVPIYEEEQMDLERPITEESLSSYKGYSDSYELALGLLYRPITELDLMAGVAYDQSPVPDETFSIDNPSLNQMIWSLGARYRSGSWTYGMAYMNISYMRRDVTTNQGSPPVNGIVQGRNHLPTLEVQYGF